MTKLVIRRTSETNVDINPVNNPFTDIWYTIELPLPEVGVDKPPLPTFFYDGFELQSSPLWGSTNYTYQIFAVNMVGISVSSLSMTVVTPPPDRPSSVVVFDFEATSYSITLLFKAGVLHGGSPITDFIISRVGSPWQQVVAYDDSQGSGHDTTDYDVQGGQTYQYTVQVRNAVGRQSDFRLLVANSLPPVVPASPSVHIYHDYKPPKSHHYC